MDPQFGALTKGKNDSTVSSLSFSGPSISGDDIVGCVHILTNAGAGDIVSGVTWGGVPMTRVAVSGAGTQRLYAYILANPSSGGTVEVTCSADSDGMYAHAFYYTGAKQTGQPDSSNIGSATGNLTLSTTVVLDNSILVSCARNLSSGVPGAGTGTTIRENDGAYAIGTGDSDSVVESGSRSMQWTAGSNTTWGIIYSLAPAGEPEPEPEPFRFQNLPGIVFDEEDTHTIYAERLNDILERLEALEE